MKNKVFFAKMIKLQDRELKRILTKLWKNDWNMSSISINEWHHLVECSLNDIQVTDAECKQSGLAPADKIFLD